MLFSGGTRIFRWGRRPRWEGGGHRPSTRALFGKNVSANERMPLTIFHLCI